ncbi:MAG: YcgL domain-containing protein [Pseudomonadota bacterium]|nr:YcgL domain-containing protein [Pseudomonadota bacterium]
MSEKVFVSVFRSSKKADTYVYVRRGFDWEQMPEGLRGLFGQPVHAMDLVMTPERKLSRTTGKEVLDAINDKNFYLQMPAESGGYVVEFRRKMGEQRR